MLPVLQASSNGAQESALIAIVIIIIVVVRRIYRTYVGTQVSQARTIGYTVFYFAFGSFFVLASFLEGVPLYYILPEVALVAIGAYFSHRLADKRITFWKSGNAIFYKGGVIIYLIYVIGLIARLSIEFVFIGPSAFTFTLVSLSVTEIYATAITDMLLIFGVGLLVGRNIRVYQRYNLITHGRESVKTTP